MYVILLALEIFVTGKRNKTDDVDFQNYISYSLEKRFPKLNITFLNRLTPEETPTQAKTSALRPKTNLDRSERQRQFSSRRIRNANSAIPLFFYFVDLFADSITLHNITMTRVLDVLLTVMKGKARPSSSLSEIVLEHQEELSAGETIPGLKSSIQPDKPSQTKTQNNQFPQKEKQE